MARYEDYLLRTATDERKFKQKYAERIAMYKGKCQSWFEKNFEPYKWRRMNVRPESAEFVIGLLCLLYREKKIQFTIQFPSDGSVELQREEIGNG
jgi:hypothetical protein